MVLYHKSAFFKTETINTLIILEKEFFENPQNVISLKIRKTFC